MIYSDEDIQIFLREFFIDRGIGCPYEDTTIFYEYMINKKLLDGTSLTEEYDIDNPIKLINDLYTALRDFLD